MDLTGVSLDTTTVGAGALLLIAALSTIWGINQVIKLFAAKK